KRISSDARIRTLADTIRKSSQGLVETVLIGPAKYNELYEKLSNLNRLLGWGHARVIENLLERKPGCPRSLSDQFADTRVSRNRCCATGATLSSNNGREQNRTSQSRRRPSSPGRDLLTGLSERVKSSVCDWNAACRLA